MDDIDTKTTESAGAGAVPFVEAPLGGIWISWERQRRTTELSSRLGAPLVCLTHAGPRWRRYLVLVPSTCRELLRRRPRWLVVQNPSIALTALACLLKPLLGYWLVVDRHTNFMLQKPASIRKSVFTVVSDWTLRRADLTIVTNSFLAELVRGRGGRPFVLQDPLPTVAPDPARRGAPLPGPYGFFVCTFAADEPYDEVIEAMGALPENCTLCISGRPPASGLPADLQDVVDRHPGIRLTGFLPDEEYFRFMAHGAFVIVLTSADHCLVCGAYEALALRRPLLLSDRSALHDYFGDQVPRYVGEGRDALTAALRAAFAGDLASPPEIDALRARLTVDWDRRFAGLVALIRSWLAGPGGR